MNREQTKELLPVMIAFAEGKEIQSSLPGDDDNWYCCSNPYWNSPTTRYRIKPEKKTGWINIYPPPAYNSQVFHNKHKADFDETHQQMNRIACIQISYEEGEGL